MRKRWSIGTVIAAVAASLVAAALGLLGGDALWRFGEDFLVRLVAPAQPEGSPAALAADPYVPEAVTITIDSIPSHALVLRDKVPIGATPMTVSIPGGTPDWNLEVTAEGYATRQIRVPTTSDGRFLARLDPLLPSAPRSKAVRPIRDRIQVGWSPWLKLIPADRLDQDEVQGRIRRQEEAFALCYERYLARAERPAFPPAARVAWLIGEGGHVQDVSLRRPNFSDEQLTKCIHRVVRETSFPDPGGGAVEASAYLFFAVRSR